MTHIRPNWLDRPVTVLGTDIRRGSAGARAEIVTGVRSSGIGTCRERPARWTGSPTHHRLLFPPVILGVRRV
ncbi:hypothetical protein C0Q70_09666 [Pomacea canaliculata]|uniref:Uncharacterized protein n=1 Tax=Pomacea canaliculata TaxID=400727 RepID=A0A2T7PAF1_POMCA|nr:hypothetical protein C0Q70_09666 [Pomacea canaliculata]